MITVYGIKQCDTVKKALKWLKNNHIEHQFHDIRQNGLTSGMIQQWITTLGWETLVNKRSTTWRNLDDSTKGNLSAQNVTELLLSHPTLIKRPILESDSTTLIGFSEKDYAKTLKP